MELVSGHLYEGGPDTKIRNHSFHGSGIAKWFPQQDEVDKNFVRGYDVDVKVRKKGDIYEFTVTLHNTKTGHDVPTGDLERFIRLELTVKSPEGEAIWNTRERIGELWEWNPKARKVSDNTLRTGERREYVYEAPVPSGSKLIVETHNHRMASVDRLKAKASYSPSFRLKLTLPFSESTLMTRTDGRYWFTERTSSG